MIDHYIIIIINHFHHFISYFAPLEHISHCKMSKTVLCLPFSCCCVYISNLDEVGEIANEEAKGGTTSTNYNLPSIPQHMIESIPNKIKNQVENELLDAFDDSSSNESENEVIQELPVKKPMKRRQSSKPKKFGDTIDVEELANLVATKIPANDETNDEDFEPVVKKKRRKKEKITILEEVKKQKVIKLVRNCYLPSTISLQKIKKNIFKTLFLKIKLIIKDS